MLTLKHLNHRQTSILVSYTANKFDKKLSSQDKNGYKDDLSQECWLALIKNLNMCNQSPGLIMSYLDSACKDWIKGFFKTRSNTKIYPMQDEYDLEDTSADTELILSTFAKEHHFDEAVKRLNLSSVDKEILFSAQKEDTKEYNRKKHLKKKLKVTYDSLF
jgi:hypothetical protein